MYPLQHTQVFSYKILLLEQFTNFSMDVLSSPSMRHRPQKRGNKSHAGSTMTEEQY